MTARHLSRMVLGAIVSGTLILVSTAGAEETSSSLCERGPLRIRNQFPLNLHHLGFPGEDAQVLDPHQASVSLEITTANIFSATEEVQQLHEAGPRRALQRDEFEALVAANPGRDQFLFDGGVGRAALFGRYGWRPGIELGLELPYISLGGGTLDSLLESFHDAFDLDQAGRTGYPKDELQIALHLDGRTRFFGSDNETRGLGDPVLSVKVSLLRESPRRPGVAMRMALKPPLHTRGNLLSSGKTDLGVNLLVAKHFRRQSGYFNAGYVVDGGWWVMPDVHRSNVWTLLAAYEFGITPRASFVIQNLTHSSFLTRATRSELAALSNEVSLGIKFDTRGRAQWAVSVTENYATFKSSPDFGIHVGWVCLLR